MCTTCSVKTILYMKPLNIARKRTYYEPSNELYNLVLTTTLWYLSTIYYTHFPDTKRYKSTSSRDGNSDLCALQMV